MSSRLAFDALSGARFTDTSEGACDGRPKPKLRCLENFLSFFPSWAVVDEAIESSDDFRSSSAFWNSKFGIVFEALWDKHTQMWFNSTFWNKIIYTICKKEITENAFSCPHLALTTWKINLSVSWIIQMNQPYHPLVTAILSFKCNYFNFTVCARNPCPPPTPTQKGQPPGCNSLTLIFCCCVGRTSGKLFVRGRAGLFASPMLAVDALS